VNFGTILDSVTKGCVKRIYEGKDFESKKLAKDFIEYVYLKEVLKRQFQIYTSLNSSFITDKAVAREFIHETLKKLNGFSFYDIQSYNALLEAKFHPEKIGSTEVNKHIANLIKYKTSSHGDTEMYITSMEKLVEHISTFREDKGIVEELSNSLSNSNLKFLEPKHVMKIAINKFNKKYGELFTEEDRKVFNILRSKDQNKIEEYRNSLINELKDHINKLSNDLENGLRGKLNLGFDRLNESKDNESIMSGYELLCELKELNK
jgi:hypothetical protein